MSELAPQGGVNLLPAGADSDTPYIQKTSLAADKPVYYDLLLGPTCIHCTHAVTAAVLVE